MHNGPASFMHGGLLMTMGESLELSTLADNEHDAENIARSLHELEWEDTGYVELEAEYDFAKQTPDRPTQRLKELLN